MNELTYDEVIKRLGFFRTNARLSLREMSGRLGYNPQFMKTIENGSIELKVKTLLDFCKVLDISIQEFFYNGREYRREDRFAWDLYSHLSSDNKMLILEIMKRLK